MGKSSLTAILQRGVLLFCVIGVWGLAAHAQPEVETEALRIDRVLPHIAAEGEDVTLLGQGFRNDSQLYWNSFELDSQFINAKEIKFTVPVGVNCGTHTLQIENPSLTIGSIHLPLERSQVREININCGPAARLSPPVISLDRVQPNRLMAGEVLTIYGGGFVSPGTKVQFDNAILNVNVQSNSKLTFNIPDDAGCGMHAIRVQSPGNGGAVIKPNKTLWIEVLCGVVVKSPSIFADFEIADFDDNGDCLIENIEIFDALDAWVNQLVDNALFFEIVDAWTMGIDICNRLPFIASQLGAVKLRHAERDITFMASTTGERLRSYEIYDLQGRQIASQRAPSPTSLSWNLRDAHNDRVANGVYLVKLERVSITGHVMNDILKLVVYRAH